MRRMPRCSPGSLVWVQCVCCGKVFTASGECHVVLLDLSCGYSVFAVVRSLLRQENATLFSWISRVGTVCLLW